MMRIFIRFLVIVFAYLVAIPGVQAQYSWQLVHTDYDGQYKYYFNRLSCSGDNCTVAGILEDVVGRRSKYMFWRSTNGGITWKMQDPNFPWNTEKSQNADFFYAVQQIDSLNIVASGDSGLILRSFDGGNSWIRQDINTSFRLPDIHFFDQLQGLTIVGNVGQNVYTTNDGGSTWQPHSIPISAPLGICHSYGGGKYKVFAYGNDPKIYSTQNNWETIDSSSLLFEGNPDYDYYFQGCMFTENDTAFLYGTYRDSVSASLEDRRGVIVRTPSSGQSWERPFTFFPSLKSGGVSWIFSMTSLNFDTAFAGGYANGKILKSFDRGNSWQIDTIVLDTNYSVKMLSGLTQTGDGSLLGLCANGFTGGAPNIIIRGVHTPSRVRGAEAKLGELHIFPNPTHDILQFTSDEPTESIELYDSFGRKYRLGTVFSDGVATADISKLLSGCYYVKAGNMMQKLIILR